MEGPGIGDCDAGEVLDSLRVLIRLGSGASP